MPRIFKGKFKSKRLEDLAFYIRSKFIDFDVFLINELWLKKDHELLMRAATEANFHMTTFKAFNPCW